MKRVLAAVLVSLAVAPAAASAAPTTGFAFGRSGGSIRPFSLTVATSGAVTATGAAPWHRTRLSKQQLANLNRVAFVTQFATLPLATNCSGTLPDVASQWIRVGDRTVRVHGTCVPRFDRLWTALDRAVTTP
jgi:hypothetical protein